MKISKRSWHYRLYRFMQNVPNGPRYLNPFAKVEREDVSVPSSLCPYAWSIFLGVIGGVTVGVVVLIIGLIVSLVLAALAGVRWVDANVPMPTLKLNAKKKPEEEKTPKVRRPSLIAAFLKSRKEKVCPMIELVD